MHSPVVLSYSQAMVEIATEQKFLPQLQEVATLLATGVRIPEVQQFLQHPKLPLTEKRKLIDRLMPEGSPQEFINFIHLIIDRRRETLLGAILEKTFDLAVTAQGQEIVELISAQPLAVEKQAEIARGLEKAWKAKLFIKYRENPNLIGGLIIRRGDQWIDGSLSGQLKAIQQELLAEAK